MNEQKSTDTYEVPLTKTPALAEAMEQKEAFAGSVRAGETTAQLGSEAVESAGIITMPESVKAALDEQKAVEAAAAPAAQPLIEMPDHLVPEGYVPPVSPEVAAQAAKDSYVPGPQAIRQHAIEVKPGLFVMPHDMDSYRASKSGDTEK